MASIKKKLSWQAFSMKDRNEIIEKIKAVISNNDGYIIHFQMFSNLALSLSIEIEENKITNLHKRLSHIINLTEPEPNNLNQYSKLDWWILMNVSFGKGKGDLKMEIPNVLG
ncbi:MAG: hypothetical protein NXI23_17415 [Bacteroidetes bacterium]|jgi:hypothetical protein|nr:hypothetical protein [Bacteroidota bacterium]MDF1866203.1 hypothetical protein [Saprospiraceae bacterium]